jgi:hypothetical protein
MQMLNFRYRSDESVRDIDVKGKKIVYCMLNHDRNRYGYKKKQGYSSKLISTSDGHEYHHPSPMCSLNQSGER